MTQVRTICFNLLLSYCFGFGSGSTSFPCWVYIFPFHEGNFFYHPFSVRLFVRLFYCPLVSFLLSFLLTFFLSFFLSFFAYLIVYLIVNLIVSLIVCIFKWISLLLNCIHYHQLFIIFSFSVLVLNLARKEGWLKVRESMMESIPKGRWPSKVSGVEPMTF